MSHDHLVPQSVDEHDAALLRRAYGLEGRDEGARLYEEWADTYDHTMVDGLGYLSPQRLAAVFAGIVAWRDVPIVDLGCGTGLVGAALAAQGFTTIDGVDLSLPMMEMADRRGIYRRLIVGDLTATLPIEDGSYGAALSAGTFTSGHVGAECLDEIVRILGPGGVLCCTVHDAVWDAFGFGDTFARLTAEGRLVEVCVEFVSYYDSSPAPDGRLCAFAKPV